MFLKKRGQISLEYMVIIGFVTLVITAILVISMMYKEQVNYQIRLNQADEVVRGIVDSAESVYYLGEPSKTTLKVYMPDGVETITIDDNEVFFQVRVSGGSLTDIVYSTNANVTGSLMTSSGIRNIKIEAIPGRVNITDL